jgi:hypothetical protein
MPHAKLGNVSEKTENFQKPENHRNHDNGIQDALDLALHRDVAVDQPKQQANHGKRDNNGDKRHFIFSNRCAGEIDTQIRLRRLDNNVLDFFAFVQLTPAYSKLEE